MRQTTRQYSVLEVNAHNERVRYGGAIIALLVTAPLIMPKSNLENRQMRSHLGEDSRSSARYAARTANTSWTAQHAKEIARKPVST